MLVEVAGKTLKPQVETYIYNLEVRLKIFSYQVNSIKSVKLI